MVDYSKINNIDIQKNAEWLMVSEIKMNAGRDFEGKEDDFFGMAGIKCNAQIKGIACMRSGKSVELLLANGKSMTITTDTNPFKDKETEPMFTELFWDAGKNEFKDNIGVVRTRLNDKNELFDNKYYRLKQIIPMLIDEDKIAEFYTNADPELREFIMKKIGDLAKSQV